MDSLLPVRFYPFDKINVVLLLINFAWIPRDFKSFEIIFLLVTGAVILSLIVCAYDPSRGNQ